MAALLQLILLAILVVASSSSLFSQRLRSRPPVAPYEWPCPNAEDILPCVCTSDEMYNLLMDCSAVTNENELKDVFDNAIFPFTEFLQLTIDQETNPSKLKLILGYSFGELTFDRIIIKNTDIEIIQEEVFTFSIDKLKYLNLAKNKMHTFPFETIPNYKVLDTFVIDDNSFTNLPPISSESLKTLTVNGNMGLTFTDLVFQDAPSLTTIGMSRIGLSALYPNLFVTLNNIKNINLSGNTLVELDENSFNPVRNTIEQLTLSNNNINFVRKLAIQGLNLGSWLYFSSNNLVELTQEVWQPVFEMALDGTIDFSDNPLRCGCDIAWIMLDGFDTYRTMITETTNCNSGEQLISLDVNYFELQCSSTTTPDTNM